MYCLASDVRKVAVKLLTAITLPDTQTYKGIERLLKKLRTIKKKGDVVKAFTTDMMLNAHKQILDRYRKNVPEIDQALTLLSDAQNIAAKFPGNDETMLDDKTIKGLSNNLQNALDVLGKKEVSDKASEVQRNLGK